VPAHINELAPDNVRGFLPGFAYQCGVAAAGSIVYIEAVLSERFSFATTMALTALTVFSLAAFVIWMGREKHAVEFGVLPEGT
jgi:SHS family lactate transporter-like MFS transporter